MQQKFSPPLKVEGSVDALATLGVQRADTALARFVTTFANQAFGIILSMVIRVIVRWAKKELMLDGRAGVNFDDGTLCGNVLAGQEGRQAPSWRRRGAGHAVQE